MGDVMHDLADAIELQRNAEALLHAVSGQADLLGLGGIAIVVIDKDAENVSCAAHYNVKDHNMLMALFHSCGLFAEKK